MHYGAVLLAASLSPSISPEPAKLPPQPPAAPPAPEEKPTPIAASPKRRIVEPHVTVVSLNSSDSRPRRRPNGLSYLAALRESEQAEKGAQ